MKTLLSLLVAVPLAWVASPARAADAPPAATFAPEAVRADFDELYARLREAHYDLYAHRSAAAQDRRFAALRASIERPMTAAQAATLFQRFVAYGRVAHARIDLPRDGYAAFRDAGGRLFPLELRVVRGRVYVTRDGSGHPDVAPGDELLAVDGRPATAWIARITELLSADTPYMRDTMLEWALRTLVWREYGDRTSLPVRVRRADRTIVAVDLPFRTAAELEAESARAPAPFELSWEAREHRMLPGAVAYLRPGPFYDVDPNAPTPWDPSGFGAFLDTAFAGFRAAGARALLIDLRDNAGGDNSFSDLMLNYVATRPYRFASSFRIKVSDAAVVSNAARLAAAGARPDPTSVKLAALYRGRAPGERVDFEIPWATPRTADAFVGPVYVLVNRHSYSNTVMVAATVQDYGFGTVLGEETSDLAATYGAMETFALSRTGIAVGFPKARIVRPSGATTARGVVPDVVLTTPIVPGTNDAVLEQALAYVAARAARATP